MQLVFFHISTGMLFLLLTFEKYPTVLVHGIAGRESDMQYIAQKI